MSSNDPRRRLVFLLSVLACVFGSVLPYVPGLPGDFVYDDHRLIVQNDGLKRPFDPSRAFLRDYYSSDLDAMGLGYYRPFAILLNEFDYRIGDGEALPFHVTNLFLHAFSSVLVLILLRGLFLERSWLCLWGAVLFAVNPVHAESVAFISGRVDPLAAVFVLACLLCHRASRQRWVWSIPSAMCWFGALLSKEMAVTAPALALVLDLAERADPRGRGIDWMRAFARYGPFGVAAIAYLLLRWLALGGLLGPATGDAVATWTRPLVVLGSYVAWILLPPPGLHLEPSAPQGLVAWGAVAAVGLVAAAAALLWIRGSRVGSAGLMWVLVTLVPVAQFRAIETELSERFLYLPSIGAALVLVALAGDVKRRALLTGAAMLLTTYYVIVLVPRAEWWRDEVSLWQRKELEDGPSLKARINLGRALAARGDREAAYRWFEAAIDLAPELEPALRAEMSTLAGTLGENTEEWVVAALERAPRDGSLWNNLGFLRFRRGELAGAEGAFRQSIRWTPMRPQAWLGLAMTKLAMGDLGESEQAARMALEIDPDLGFARGVLGECLLRSNRPCEALEVIEGLTFGDEEDRGRLERLQATAKAACRDSRLPK